MTAPPVSTGYAPRRPTGPIAEVVLCEWDATFSGPHTLVPDGCVEVMWVEHRGLVVCGPETQAWSFDYPTPREAGGVRLRPGIAASLLRTRLDELRDQVVPLAALVGDRAERAVRTRIEHGEPASTAIRTLVDERASELDVPSAVGVLVGHHGPLGAVVEDLGWSPRRLHRTSLLHFGYGPSVLRSVLRLQRTLELARRHPSLGLAQLAATGGYTDQSHLAREVRRWSGMTPRQLLASEASDWHGGVSVAAVRSVQERHALAS